MSLGWPGGQEVAAIDTAVNNLVDRGVVVVSAAGNDQQEVIPYVASPGLANKSITVGAVNETDQIAYYSSLGNPARTYIKPDVVAPGGSSRTHNLITSVDSNDADHNRDRNDPNNPSDDVVFITDDQYPNDYQTMQGTSMATPHVSGLAELVADAMDSWSYNSNESSLRVKMILSMTAFETNMEGESASPTLDRGGKDRTEGYGRISADAAIEAVTLNYLVGTIASDTLGEKPTDKKVWARRVNLISGKQYEFTLSVPASADYDLYLYNGIPDANGDPIILKNSTMVENGASEYITYTPTISDNSYIVVKWVRGDGYFSISSSAGSKKYTSDADFDKGVLTGLEHDTIHDQLQLSKNSTAFPFIWVPNTGQGTISKVDTVTGKELGRYRVAPATINPSPSRTTVDLMGNVWVGNRQAGTVVKVGLSEAGQCIDRNGNANIETSLDTNNDGNITGTEMLAWGSDECVLYEVVLIPGNLGTFTPGTYTGGYDTNYWGVSPRGLAIDAANNLWAGTSSTQKYYYINESGTILKNVSVSALGHHAYGAIIDSNGILWSASWFSYGSDNHILRLDPSTGAISKINISHQTYGIGIDSINHLFVAGFQNSRLTRINISTGAIEWTKAASYEARGVAATNDNNVWLANTNPNTVTRYDNNGNLKATISGFNQPSGVAVDSEGKVWVTDINSEKIYRINTTSNLTDLTKVIIGSGGHYTYSDMTGFVSRGITTKIGTWTVIYDSGSTGTTWGRVSWNSSVPAGGSITVRIRTSETPEGLQVAKYQSVSNSMDFTAPGRYIQIETTLTANSAKESPILYDLTVEPASERSLKGMVFDDANGNGIKNIGESGLSGVNVRISRMISPGVDSPVSSTNTNVNGNYSFLGLTPGNYKVEMNLSGFARSQTYPAGGSPHYIIFSGTPIQGKDFGARPVAGGKIQGLNFNDSNDNGVQNPGELGIKGVTVCLWPSSRCTATNNSGNYEFTNVPPGEQTVYEIVPPGNTSTTPTIVNLTINSGDIKTVNFGNRKLIPPLPDVIVPKAIMVNNVPEVFSNNPLVVRKDLSAFSSNVNGVNLTLKWSDGTIKNANMVKLGVTKVWEATFSPPFPDGTAQMTFKVDIDPAGPGNEDAIQIGDIIFIDPSGRIKSKCTNAPINGANTTLLIEFPPHSGNFIISPPAYQIEPNPQITGEDGKYGWMASAGRYKVRTEKEGYVSAESIVVEVPPAVTDLDIELDCNISTYPSISFTYPTPANGISLTNNHAYINTSVTNAATAFIDWNRSMAGWWRFNNENSENSSFFRDWSTRGNNGTCSGTNCPASTSGKFGNALNFDGINDYIDAGNSASLDITGAITIEAWINPTIAQEKCWDGVSGNYGVISKVSAPANSVNCSWALRYGAPVGGCYLGFDFNGNPEGSRWVTVKQNLTPGEWYHIVGTFNGTDINSYLNGNLKDSNKISAIKGYRNKLLIGNDGWSNLFNGKIDEVRIHRRALSPDEIKASYDAGINRLYRNFTGLAIGPYNYQAYAQNLAGAVNQTEKRTLNVTVP